MGLPELHPPMSTKLRLLLLVLAPLLLMGCGAARPAGSATDGATLRVENQAFNDMTIYAVAGAQSIRLGTVTGNSTAVLRIPATVVGMGQDMSFRADPIGSSAVSSSFTIFVAPGEEVTITIPPREA